MLQGLLALRHHLQHLHTRCKAEERDAETCVAPLQLEALRDRLGEQMQALKAFSGCNITFT